MGKFKSPIINHNTNFNTSKGASEIQNNSFNKEFIFEKRKTILMTVALLCKFTAQHVPDVNTSLFRSLQLLVALLCRLYCADMRHVGVM